MSYNSDIQDNNFQLQAILETVNSLPSQGESPRILVTAPTGSTVVATKGSIIVNAQEVNGSWTFQLPEFGVWTVTATKDDQSATKDINVVHDYNATLCYFAATITVTYPAGSSCTCTDGMTTLNAPNTSGSYTFTVPNAGMWTVSCTDGTDTESASVSITTDGQSVSATLSYIPYLYNVGDECIALTGGWQARALTRKSGFTAVAPTLTKNATNMVIIENKPSSGNAAGIAEVINDIDLTDYSAIKLQSINSGTTSTFYPSYLSVIARNAISWDTGSMAKAQLFNGDVLTTLDVSALSGSYDVVIGLYQTGSENTSATVSQMWLE